MLVGLASLPNLRSLTLFSELAGISWNYLSSLTNLTELNLRHIRDFGDNSGAITAKLYTLSSLQSVSINAGDQFTDAELLFLASSRDSLRKLSICTNGYVFSLDNLSPLKCLTDLDLLSLPHLTPDQPALGELPALRRLALPHSVSIIESLLSLGQGAPRLESLELSPQAMTNDFARAIAALTSLSFLEIRTYSDNIKDNHVQYLSSLQMLTRMFISSPSITAHAFSTMHRVTTLKALGMYCGGLRKANVERLLPGVQVTH